MQIARTALRLAWLLLVAPLLLGGSIAQAEGDLNARLKGEYAFTQIHFCVSTRVSGQHFGPGFSVPSGGATTSTRSNEGILTFDGQGTGSFDGKTLTINHSATGSGALPVSEAEFTCPLTYAVNADGTFTTHLACSARGLSGAGAGTPSTVTGLELHGQLQDGGRLFIANDTRPNVETVTSTSSDGVTSEFERICGRSQTAIKVRHAGAE